MFLGKDLYYRRQSASHSMPPQVQNHGLFLAILLSTDQSQARHQLLSQNMQNCMASNGVQRPAGLQAALPPVSGVTQTIPNTVVQDPDMQSIPGVSQNSVGNSMGQGNPSTMFANSQRQMPASLDSTAQTGHAKGADWQKEIYQKIKVMKETYFPEINEMYRRIAAKLQQHDSHPQQPKSEQLEKLQVCKAMLERLITFLHSKGFGLIPTSCGQIFSVSTGRLNFLKRGFGLIPTSCGQIFSVSTGNLKQRPLQALIE